MYAQEDYNIFKQRNFINALIFERFKIGNTPIKVPKHLKSLHAGEKMKSGSQGRIFPHKQVSFS